MRRRSSTALAAAGERGWTGRWSDYSAPSRARRVIPGSPGTTQSRSMTERDLLLGSSFHLSAGGDAMAVPGSGARWTAWGRASLERFENTGTAGCRSTARSSPERVRRRPASAATWLAGPFALSHSVGEGAHAPARHGDGVRHREHGDGAQPVRAPPAQSERVSAWALAGYGDGRPYAHAAEAGDTGQDGEERTTRSPAAPRWKTDIAMTLGAAGCAGRGAHARGERRVSRWRVKGDAFWVRTTSDALRERRGSRQPGGDRRGREPGAAGPGGLAGDGPGRRERTPNQAAATLTPSLELGVRHDGGDAETGAGLEARRGPALRRPVLRA